MFELSEGWGRWRGARPPGMRKASRKAAARVRNILSREAEGEVDALITEKDFGCLPTGEPARLFTLAAGDIAVRVSDFGATLVGIDAPSATGELADVMLGFDSVEGYAGDDPACFGCTIGPVANRTAGAEIPLDGETYHLPVNENGANNLHTDLAHGLHKRLWRVERTDNAEDGAAELVLSCDLEHGEYGLPGNRTVTATYRVSPANVLTLRYTMTTDYPTFANITNHGYFNLAGNGSGDVLAQRVAIDANRFVAIGAGSIPTGELRGVAGTPFDFTEPHELGERIGADDDQIKAGTGYDHCFCVDGYKPAAAPRRALTASDPASGRTMTVSITVPGIQLYTGNWLGDENAKGGASYAPHAGFAVEPQFYPDCAHHVEWPQPVCRPGQPFVSEIEYAFTVAR